MARQVSQAAPRRTFQTEWHIVEAHGRRVLNGLQRALFVNTADYLLEAGDPGGVALVTDKGQFSYGDIRQAAARVIGELAAVGVRPGDRVGLLAGNSLFWVAAYLGIMKLGAIAVPLAASATRDDLMVESALAACKAICAERRLLSLARALLSDQIGLVTDEVLHQTTPCSWPAEQSIASDETEAALMFTSGTTARPRAVRVTHRNIQANTEAIIACIGLSKAERMLVILPFHYCFGTSLLHTHLRVGGTLVISNTFTYPETTLDLMAHQKCTGFAGVPSVFQLLLRSTSFPRRDWPALRKIQQAGGHLPSVFVQELQAAVPHAEIYTMYGQTEATARLSCLPPALLETKRGSIGKGIPGVELRVVGASGANVAPGEVGEIIACGPSISPGYWQDPQATAERFAKDGMHTGDLATVDEDGYVFIVGRISDFVKSFGYRVSCQQVEACILELSEVVAAAVVGEPDLVRGEAIVAYVTLRAGSNLSPQQILAHCAARLARHMVPVSVTVLEHLPMSAQGKVMKSRLRQPGQPPAVAAQAAGSMVS
jgi:acyl-CoA synthetase (AMP-forming)/AMP-acid ligase II